MRDWTNKLVVTVCFVCGVCHAQLQMYKLTELPKTETLAPTNLFLVTTGYTGHYASRAIEAQHLIDQLMTYLDNGTLNSNKFDAATFAGLTSLAMVSNVVHYWDSQVTNHVQLRAGQQTNHVTMVSNALWAMIQGIDIPTMSYEKFPTYQVTLANVGNGVMVPILTNSMAVGTRTNYWVSSYLMPSETYINGAGSATYFPMVEEARLYVRRTTGGDVQGWLSVNASGDAYHNPEGITALTVTTNDVPIGQYVLGWTRMNDATAFMETETASLVVRLRPEWPESNQVFYIK